MTMTIVAALFVAALTVAYVAYPLLRRAAHGEAQNAGYDETLDQLLATREGAYQAIRDLDFDYQTGKLAEDDYRLLRARYAAQAVSVMQTLDQYDQEVDESALEDIVEQEILDARRRASKERQALRRGRDRKVCPECGQERRDDDRFCPRCGAALSMLCPDCGASFDEGDRFCARCGAGLISEAEPVGG